jgi:hypothetical protein
VSVLRDDPDEDPDGGGKPKQAKHDARFEQGACLIRGAVVKGAGGQLSAVSCQPSAVSQKGRRPLG